MPTEANKNLDELMSEAAAASPADRISYRNAIASFGSAAVVALEPWLADRRLAGFAVRTIGRVASDDRDQAVQVLRAGFQSAPDERVKNDIREELQRLGVSPSARRRKHSQRRISEPPRVWDDSDLVVGEYYTRQHLKDKYGGTIYRGISYPEDADYIQLFSDPTKANETGYRDRWEGPNEYWYAGQWNGPGDMELKSMNQRILDRSPRLHLFIADHEMHRYEGRFSCDGHHPEPSENDGVPATAIVFELHRVIEGEG